MRLILPYTEFARRSHGAQKWLCFPELCRKAGRYFLAVATRGVTGRLDADPTGPLTAQHSRPVLRISIF